MEKDNSILENELDKAKRELEELKEKSRSLQKAIWDMLNYANMYVVILDPSMNIKLINYSLAKELGFESENDPLGRCWLDFIREEDREQIKITHAKVAFEQDIENFGEVTNYVLSGDGSTFLVKWFNVPINSQYNVTMSFGLPRDKRAEITEESIRSYYRDILEKDKTMIKSLKESLFGEASHACNPTTGKL